MVGRKGPFLASMLQFFVSQPNQHCERFTRQIDNQTFVPFNRQSTHMGPDKGSSKSGGTSWHHH